MVKASYEYSLEEITIFPFSTPMLSTCAQVLSSKTNSRSMCVCVCVCIFIKLHITAQSGPVILVILCHSH